MRLITRDVVVLSFTCVSFALIYYSIYPLHAPISGYFMIESIPTYFWFLYTSALVFNVIFLSSPLVTSRCLRASLTYILIYLCSLRTFASLHFTGFMGSDSPCYLGLTQYWISHDHINLAKTSYGDNPGLFILSKIVILVTDLDVNLYTIIIGIMWIAIVYLVFRLMTLRYIAIIRINHSADYDRGEYTSTMIPLVATLSYFALAVPFTVNFQYAPQTYALVLLLFYFFLLGSFLIKHRSSQVFVPILITYTAIQISHPFMFMFGISTIALLISARWFNKSSSLSTDSLYTRRSGLVMLLLVMITLSSVHILYQTVLLQRRVGEVIKNILEAFELRFPVEYFERLSAPAFPHYEFSYYLIAVIHSVTWIVITAILAILVLKTLISRVPKYYEFSIIVGSTVALIAFMSTLMLQEFVTRAGQVLLFGALLLAIKSMTIKNNRLQMASSKLLVSLLLGLLVLSSLLAFVRYTWYTQPSHLSPNDVIIVNTLENLLGSDHIVTIFSRNALGVYYCSKNYGTPFALCKTPILSAPDQHASIEKYDLILWDRSLSLELLKYTGKELSLNVLLSQRNVLVNTDGIIAIGDILLR